MKSGAICASCAASPCRYSSTRDAVPVCSPECGARVDALDRAVAFGTADEAISMLVSEIAWLRQKLLEVRRQREG